MLFNTIIGIHALEVQQSAIENTILKTASKIRNTTNEIFLAMKLKGIKNNPKLKQYSLIHNYFSSLTSKDHDTLNQIAKESRVDTINNDNDTHGYIDAINELLNEGPDNIIEEINKDSLPDLISSFLTKLEYLKDANDVNNNNFNINNQILNLLRNEDPRNVTEDRESDENDSLLSDNDFWVPEESGRRIYEGDKTKIKYFPFMASIQIFNNFQCAGCIIKSDLIITAASCLQLAWNNRFFRENPAFLSVRIGSNFYRGGGENVAVLEVYFHPEYNPKTLTNNICLLRLIRRINFKKKKKSVKKIDFDRTPSNLPINTDGVTIVGWGAKGISNIVRNPWSNQLSFAVLDIYPVRECQDIYSRQYVTRKNFCAGFFSKGGGACNGDVGGPGIVNGLLAGIVSFGSPVCGTPDAPTVFTTLGYYTDWIEDIMEQEVPQVKQWTTLRPTPPPITIPRYATLKPTTFVLEPIVGTWKPVGINERAVESLRILDDENLFKEFLATMFGSKEAKDYEELFVNKAMEEKSKHIQRQKKVERHKKDKPEKSIPESVAFVTKTYEDTTQLYPFTALDKFEEVPDNFKEEESEEISDTKYKNKINQYDKSSDNESTLISSDDDEVERNILKLIENIDVSDKEEANDLTDIFENYAQEIALKDENNIPRNETLKNVDDPILTLLYLSDSEKTPGNVESIGNVIEDFDDHVNEGLSIAMDGFKDLTFRDNGTGSLYDFLPKEEMYELLAEAIDDVAKDKDT